MSDAETQIRQAFDLTREGRPQEARETMENAAATGSGQACVFAATWRLIGYGGSIDAETATDFLERAAANGEPLGLTMLAALAVADLVGPRDWARSLGYLRAAAERDEPRAKAQLALLMRNDVPQWPHERAIPSVSRLRESPRVESIQGLLSAAECAHVVARGAAYLQRAQVAGPGGAPIHDPIRTNDAMVFEVVETDVLIQSIDSLVARVLESPAEHGERFGLLRYRPGQAYAPHCDWIDPAAPGKDVEVARSGQRVATLLVYLNDGFRGGETHFVRLNWSFKGKCGDALFWRNVTQEGGIEPLTLHAGLPPTAGEKWLLSKWMRSLPQFRRE